jgi:chemotaxis protein MotB
MAGMQRKPRKKGEEANLDYMLTYGDLVTLVLCFFAVLYNPVTDTEEITKAISDYFNSLSWGISLTEGQMAETGNMIADLPSMTTGTALGDAMRRAVSLFQAEVRSNRVKITQDERGIVISLASDVFFNSASATINIEAARSILFNLATLLSSEEVAGRKFRIEGHTDSTAIDPTGPWLSNWQLSTERSLSVLYYLVDLGISENRMQVSGFGSTMPFSSDDSAEGRAYNRRVDIVIVDDAHL